MEIPRLFRKSKRAALPPGTLVHLGDGPSGPPRIRLFEYDATHFDEKESPDLRQCLASSRGPRTAWIEITGIRDTDLIMEVGQLFDIHPLVLEDIVHTGQRPKVEDHENLLYIVAIMLRHSPAGDELCSEQVSIILGKGYIISFQEGEGGVFDPIRERLRRRKGRIREHGADYLAYTLLDAIVDNYFLVLERVGEKIEETEETVITDPDPGALQSLHDLRRSAIFIRRSVWPLRDVLSQLERGGSRLFTKTTAPYLRDVYDHTIRVIETVETYRDLTSGLLDLYLSTLSNRMNEVMKTLTIIATIFIPLTFIAGIYGMNFERMPELGWRYGYFDVLALMALLAAGLLYYFRRKRWL